MDIQDFQKTVANKSIWGGLLRMICCSWLCIWDKLLPSPHFIKQPLMPIQLKFQEIYLLGMDFSYSVERHDDNTITKANISNHMREIEEEEKRFYKGNLERYSVTYMADIDLQLASFLYCIPSPAADVNAALHPSNNFINVSFADIISLQKTGSPAQ